MIWILRCLALAHYIWGGALLAAAAWIALSAFRVLPHMSTGSIWTNLPAVLFTAATGGFAPAAFGIWMCLLGRKLWPARAPVRRTLLWTHGFLFALGALAVAAGLQSIEAAEQSVARGGGLLSPLAYVPLLFGAPMTVLAFWSLAVALVALPPQLPAEDAASTPLPVRPEFALGLRVLALLVLAAVPVAGLHSIWPAAPLPQAVPQALPPPARARSDITAVREIAGKPQREVKAFLRSAILNGRLEVIKAFERDATLALLAANLPDAFECLDLLDAESKRVLAKVEKQSGPRTAEDGRTEDAHVDVLGKMHALLTALHEVERVPAGMEAFLEQHAARVSAARLVAIGLMGRLDLRSERRTALLLSYAANGDDEAVLAALQALGRMGVEAAPALEDLRRIAREYWSNPATASLSWSVDRTVETIEKQVKREAPERR
jgi:hypothetical protein